MCSVFQSRRYVLIAYHRLPIATSAEIHPITIPAISPLERLGAVFAPLIFIFCSLLLLLLFVIESDPEVGVGLLLLSVLVSAILFMRISNVLQIDI